MTSRQSADNMLPLINCRKSRSLPDLTTHLYTPREAKISVVSTGKARNKYQLGLKVENIMPCLMLKASHRLKTAIVASINTVISCFLFLSVPAMLDSAALTVAEYRFKKNVSLVSFIGFRLAQTITAGGTGVLATSLRLPRRLIRRICRGAFANLIALSGRLLLSA